MKRRVCVACDFMDLLYPRFAAIAREYGLEIAGIDSLIPETRTQTGAFVVPTTAAFVVPATGGIVDCAQLWPLFDEDRYAEMDALFRGACVQDTNHRYAPDPAYEWVTLVAEKHHRKQQKAKPFDQWQREAADLIAEATRHRE